MSATEQPPAGLALLFIAGFLSLLYLACAGLVIALRLPWNLSLPWPVRAVGLVLAVAGGALAGSVVRFRGFAATLTSTYATLVKLVRRAPIAASVGRMEPLVVRGPYRWVRHPMYAGVIGMTIGIGLAVDGTAALLGALALFLWFEFVLAPFEEKELRVLFGPAYDDYMLVTPRFVPIPRRRG